MILMKWCRQLAKHSRERERESGVSLFKFIYHSGHQSLPKTRYAAFSRQAASGKINPQALPPTEGAAKQHSLRAYCQLWDWISLESMHLDPLKYGWRLSEENKFEPIPSLEPIAPQELLESNHCNCHTNCNNLGCSCKKNGLRCISACGICQGTSCQNSMVLVDFPETEEWWHSWRSNSVLVMGYYF